MTNQEAIAKLKYLQNEANEDRETAHIEADEVLCEILQSLGYDEVVREYHLIHKWFA